MGAGTLMDVGGPLPAREVVVGLRSVSKTFRSRSASFFGVGGFGSLALSSS